MNKNEEFEKKRIEMLKREEIFDIVIDYINTSDEYELSKLLSTVQRELVLVISNRNKEIEKSK
tara:strand:- start:111 stop:299 length:189 start_codon:yes stop_codon:yes gene_type:complete